jgi:RHS repeat-associated protein
MDPSTKSYDPSGNMTIDNATGNTYLYDGEGRVCAVSSTPVPGFTTMTGYVYDAEGNRVAKGTITSMSCDPSVNGIATANNETDYVLGPGGEQVTEMAQDANGTMNWQRTYVYAAGAGGLIGTYDPNPDNQTQPLPSFRLTDWLGTLRATTDAYGVAQGTCTGLPFGDGVTCSGDIPDNHHFTGKERDTESGNDYFGARYYASSMGRWLSPDWSAKEEPVPYAKMDDPQSLNLYVYVLNNPMTGIDKDGHECGGPGQAACRAKPEPGDQTQAQNHGFWWKVGHALGIVQTPEEQHKEAEFYRHIIPGSKDMSDKDILHAVHTVMAMSMPGEGALGEAGETAEGLGGAASDANKLNHIFGKAAHNLDGLVSEFGSQEAAYNALQKATQEVVRQQGLTGVFETSVKVGSQTVTVRGAVVDGVAKIGTAFQ